MRSQSKKKVRFYFVTLKLHGSTCYVNWAILIGDLVDVTTLLLMFGMSNRQLNTDKIGPKTYLYGLYALKNVVSEVTKRKL